jgi:uncharacterized protein
MQDNHIPGRERVRGLDAARCLALFGMMLIHFDGELARLSSPPWLDETIDFLYGKASATFVIIAGIGISLMAKASQKKAGRFYHLKVRLLKRGVFLFILGLLFWHEWDADILHYYGVYFILSVFLLPLQGKTILIASLLTPFTYVASSLFMDYHPGWNWVNLTSAGFLIKSGFLQELFLTGYYPVLPWMAFMSFGIYLGRNDLTDERFLIKCLIGGLAIFFTLNILSEDFLYRFGIPGFTEERLYKLLDTESNSPFYMFSAGGFSLSVISLCLILSRRFPSSFLIKGAALIGQMTLSLYLAHIMIGIDLLNYLAALDKTNNGVYALVFTVRFFFVSLIAVLVWKTRFQRGPVEHLMDKLTNVSLFSGSGETGIMRSSFNNSR